MAESPYILPIQAIGWIALQDFDGASRHLEQYRFELKKWQVSDLNVLRDYLESLKNGENWSLKKWQKSAEHSNAHLDISHIENTLANSKKTVAQLIASLIRYQNKYRDIWIKLMDAQKVLIEQLKNERIKLRGIRCNGDGHPEPFPLGVIRRPGFNFLWKNSNLDNWEHIELNRSDVRALWPGKGTDEQPASKPLCPSINEISAEYIRLQQNSMNPKGRELRKTLKDTFPSAKAKDIDTAIINGNKQIGRGRGAPKKMAKNKMAKKSAI